MRIGILVVAYNAQSTLHQVLQRVPLEIMDKVEEVFVFDDASQDETHKVGEALRDSHAPGKISIFRNDENQMYGGNQRRGYEYAIERGFDIVVLLHGDGQYAPEVMQELLGPLERGEADMVMGSRMLIPGGALRGNMPMYKFVGNKILTTTQNFLIGSNFSEFHSGYRAYSVAALKTIQLERLTHNWHFDTQIILQMLRRRFRVLEVPIPTYYGDEICRVNGIPYAAHCLHESLKYRLAQQNKSRREPRRRLSNAPRPKK